MCKKIFLIITIVLVATGMVWAGPNWNGATGDGLWTTNANWDSGVAPATGDTPIVRTAYYAEANYPVFAAGMDGNYGSLIVGYPDAEPNNYAARLDVIGGTMTVGSLWISFGFSSPYMGVINMSGGDINVTSEIRVGHYGAVGTLNMTGGQLSTAGNMFLGSNGGKGTIHLYGGTITVGYLGVYDGSTIDISGTGTIIIDGNQIALIDSYVYSGCLTGYGRKSVTRDYNITYAGKTTVTVPAYDVGDGYSAPEVYLPQDFNSLTPAFLSGGTGPGDVVWQKQNFNYIDFNQVTQSGTTWVRFNFNRKSPSQVTPGAYFLYRSRIAPYQYSLRVKNDSAVSVTVSSPDYLSNRTQLSPGQESVLTFSTFTWMGLVVHDVNNATDYSILLKDLTIDYPTDEQLDVNSLSVPVSVTADQNATFHLSTAGTITGQVLDIEVRHEPWIIWRIRLTGTEIAALKSNGSCDIIRTVPWYLPAGNAFVGLVADGKRVSYIADVNTTIINSISPQLPLVERRTYNGRPAFFLNDQPYNWCGYCLVTGSLTPGAFMEFGASGANMFLVETGAGQHINTLLGSNWLGGDQYDFGKLEQDVTTALQANPNAYIVIRPTLRLPSFWYQGNESSQVLVRSDLGDLVWKEEGYKAASLGSNAWRTQQETVLRKLIQFCKAQPWAKQVVAFWPACETTSEWFAWAVNDGFYSDYSAINENSFQAWCTQKGFSFPRIPDPCARERIGYDLFPADANGKWAAAYSQYYTDQTTNAIHTFADIIKNETGGRSLVGVLYAYLLQLSGCPTQNISGQLGFRSIVDDPNIDFISGIPNWWFRNYTGAKAYDGHASATESVQAAGKLYVNENDLFSWLMSSFYLYDANDPRGGAISMHRRVIAHDIVTGTSAEWFSLDPAWHHDTALQAEFANQIKLHEDSLKYDRTPTEEVAFVVDDTSFAWVTPSTLFPSYTNDDMLSGLAHTGAPVGVWVLSDLDKLPARIKVVVIAQAQAALPADITKLQNLINAGGRTIIIIGTPGLINPLTQVSDTSAPATITGLPIVVQDALLNGSAYLVSTSQQLYYGPSVRPRPYLNTTGTIRYAGTPTVYAGGERPLSNNGRLIWCGVPPYALVSLLRTWLSDAGVTFYTPSAADCFVYASKELVSITSTSTTDGQITLTWPTNSVVKDLFDGWTATGTSFSCPFNHGQTRLFEISTFASLPNPADSATNVGLNPTLIWTAGIGATSHDVYFGTNLTNVTNATHASGEFKGNQAGTTYVPGTLVGNTTYYWRIDEVGNGGTLKGSVWSFTTTTTPPTFVAAGAVTSGTGTITPALPAGIATNDILLLFLETSNQAISISNQNGGTWTSVTNSPQGTGTAGGTTGARLTAFWSRYNGTQGAPTTSDSGDHQLGRMIAIRGAAASGNPWDVTAGGVEATSDTSGSIPGTTTTVGNTLVVTAIATSLPDASSTAKFSAWTNANLTSITERIDNSVTAGNGGGLGVATGVKVTAGVYGNTAVTLANAAYKGMMSIA
ncbi:MAG TPA: hypothetical protein DD726_10190, partial [Phycisphaerales bacterium]|nr:hypothetical protein [Phycisphaerales bacterium]